MSNGEDEIRAFLLDLTEHRQASPSTMNQALAAILFLYREVLRRPVAKLGPLPRPRPPRLLPAVLTPEEVRRVLANLAGTPRLIGLILYGSGLRLMECLTLRIKDIDLARGRFGCVGARGGRIG